MRVAGHDDDGEDIEPEGDRDDATRAARREAELNDLAGKAAGGDKRALERLLALIRTPVVRYCRARMGDGIGLLTAEDVAQDVLFAVCGALARFRPGETAAMAFVYGIARNKVVDAFRAGGRDHSEPTEAVPDEVDDRLGPEAVAVFGTEVGELRDLLTRLPPAHREILVLRVALQFSAEETAAAVGSTPGAVRVTQHRALTKLRTLIAERMKGDQMS
ncbi:MULTISPECIES: RNA polymerase sigma factor ShbA [unclassified Pseudonocardia]|uniref:RNA polymerase sigma factor ShbA n=1 Tax=unclassified Pseudonocardia TaxID=2619320 RepID=UPI0025EEDF79|nr:MULTISPECIES: RNA polymerase sigma factor ShbA [unclassified Pseudonocardia]